MIGISSSQYKIKWEQDNKREEWIFKLLNFTSYLDTCWIIFSYCRWTLSYFIKINSAVLSLSFSLFLFLFSLWAFILILSLCLNRIDKLLDQPHDNHDEEKENDKEAEEDGSTLSVLTLSVCHLNLYNYIFLAYFN